MKDISIYILTHKKFDYEKNDIYKPLLNGAALLNEDFGYLRDDTGDNISNLNPYYAELTGEYWAWKNSKSDIIGFCHYRRYFSKTIFLKKLEKEDIESILDNYDIIVPQRLKTSKPLIESIGKKSMLKIDNDEMHKSLHTKQDYLKLREIIKEKSPEYLESYDEMLNGKYVFLYNMFICRKEILDGYFTWLFMILEEFRKTTDFSKYGKNKRLLGHLSERLLQVYINKHDLKYKEQYILNNELRVPNAVIIQNKYPLMNKFFMKLLNMEYWIKNRK